MKKTIWALLATAGVAGLLSGCASTAAEGVMWERIGDRAVHQDVGTAQTMGERMHTIKTSVDTDARSLIDDIDYILLRDRPSRLSRWHDR